MKEKDVVKAVFSVLIIVFFKRLGGGLRIHSELRLESRSFIKLFVAGPYGCETQRLPNFIDKELADVIIKNSTICLTDIYCNCCTCKSSSLKPQQALNLLVKEERC
jgi:hypothetical protein